MGGDPRRKGDPLKLMCDECVISGWCKRKVHRFRDTYQPPLMSNLFLVLPGLLHSIKRSQCAPLLGEPLGLQGKEMVFLQRSAAVNNSPL